MVAGSALVSLSTIAQTTYNTLSIPDIEADNGTTVQLPVNIDNQDEIIALQFDLTLPSGIEAASEAVTLTNRTESHSATARMMASGKLRVMLYSMENTAIGGNSGTALYINLTVADNLPQSSVLPLEVSDAILSDRAFDNVLTEVTAGVITIKPSADLVPLNISVDKAEAMPGDQLTVNWAVSNIGAVATTGGWREQIYLIAGDNTKLVATTYNPDATLGPLARASRSVTFVIPDELGVDGTTSVRVKVVPNSDCGEPVSVQGNNTLTSDALLTLGKRLTTSFPTSFNENGSKAVKCLLTRSGNRRYEQTFNLSIEGDERISVPQTVTIGFNETSAYFTATITNDQLLNASSEFTLTVTGDDYDPLVIPFTIIDDEKPELLLSMSKVEITEGEDFVMTITTERPLAVDATVNIFCDEPSRFTYPATVTIPAGTTSVDVTIQSIDNDDVQSTVVPTFVVSGEMFDKASDCITLIDNDMPALTLDLTPTIVTEDAGPYAIAATLRRTSNTNTKITIKFSDNSTGDRLSYDSKLVMDKGVDELQFSIAVVDNALVDGDEEITFNAAVWISSCSCASDGEMGGLVSKTITVLDNDGPALSLSASASTWLEGHEYTLTVGHNDQTRDEALTVTLSSDQDDILTYDHTVTIPAGATSVSIPVAVALNDTQGDSSTIVFTLTDPDGTFTRGTTWVMISDQTLPDAKVTGVEFYDGETKASEVYALAPYNIAATIENIGYAPLPAQTSVQIYVDSKSIGYGFTNQEIAVGATGIATLYGAVASSTVGTHKIVAEANATRDVSELLYSNNKSVSQTFTTLAPFTISLNSIPASILSSETLAISGQLSAVSDKIDMEGIEIEVYVINNNYRQTLTATTDELGTFEVEFEPVAGQVGHFVVGACFPGETLTDQMQAFDIYGLRRSTSSYIKNELATGERTLVTFDIVNPSSVTITGVTAVATEIPDDVTVEPQPIGDIAAGATATVEVYLTSTAPSASQIWYPVQLSLKSDNGEPLAVTLYEYTRNLQAKLTGESTSIITTTFADASRTYPYTITNEGLGETGTISLALPSWMKSETPVEMASLASGESAQIVLRFEPWDGIVPNVPISGQIGINCVNGNGLSIPYRITPVSDLTGNLRVKVTDEYTYNTSEAPLVANATVTLKNGYTNTTVGQRVTDSTGIVNFEEVPEGYYTLYVTADNHDSYKANIIISPGETNIVTAFLPYQAITITWEVEETEVEDEYNITTTVVYETNVPKPVVVLTVPDSIPYKEMAVGERRLYYATMTNKGLITAKNTEFVLPASNIYYEFEWLTPWQNIEILPQQTVVVPFYFHVIRNYSMNHGVIKVARPKDTDDEDTTSAPPCTVEFHMSWEFECGGSNQFATYNTGSQITSCLANGSGNTFFGSKTVGSEGLGTPGSNSSVSGTFTANSATTTDTSTCNQCEETLKKDAFDFAISFTPFSCVYSLLSASDHLELIKNFIGCLPTNTSVNF